MITCENIKKHKIQILREDYNKLVNIIHKNKSVYSTLDIPENEINDVISYEEVPTHMGMVCGICGLNGFERKILYSTYEEIIKKMNFFIKKYNLPLE